MYTGEGGNDPSTGKQVAHQSWNSPGNAGLQLSHKKDFPVRVIRGSNHISKFSPKSGYRYDGIFKVTNSEMVLGKSGFKICRFTLNKIGADSDPSTIVQEGNLVLLKSPVTSEKWYTIEVEAPNAKSISIESNLAQKLIGKKVGDEIDFGPGLEILEIRKYLG